MSSGGLRFDRFTLDPEDRRLTLDGTPVELNARYLDALALLVREPGKLVTKDRFLDEVWRGVPVTDEALTQCIRSLRRALGDDAGRPRFIETVPKHGYRFIAVVEVAGEIRPASRPPVARGSDLVPVGLAGMLGGGAAGAVGGLFYGFAGATPDGGGAISVVLVLVCVTALVGLAGGAGVSFGVAAAGDRSWRWVMGGGALGGLLVGAVVKLIGVDAFSLLLGHAPDEITGAPEGALLGAAVGFSAWLAGRGSLRRGVVFAGLITGAAGVLIPLLQGRLMSGSLDRLSAAFPGSRFHLDRVGALFGETGFGPVSQTVTAGLEGALFGAAVVAVISLVRRRTTAP